MKKYETPDLEIVIFERDVFTTMDNGSILEDDTGSGGQLPNEGGDIEDLFPGM